ncbi:MAG: alpha/beta hydrolase fold domain-containing protein [Aureliella sp.]
MHLTWRSSVNLHRMFRWSLSAVLIALVASTGWAQDKPAQRARARRAQAAAPALPKPTEGEVKYGPHERNVLDFWKAKSDSPTPLIFAIHGGGWQAGSKERVASLVKIDQVLDAGISVVSINYRYVAQAAADGTTPPVKAPLYDAARALQFVRSKADEWNIDKTRIGATGSSAGACSSLWLAFHDDLADPNSKDPIARESTRLTCAAVAGAQTTLDPKQMKEWTPNSKYGAHAFGITVEKGANAFEEFLRQRDKIQPWIAEYSPYALVSSDDAPVYLIYVAPPAMGQEQKDPTHTANFGVKLQEKCEEKGVPCELVYPGAENVKHKSIMEYLVETLKAPAKAK